MPGRFLALCAITILSLVPHAGAAECPAPASIAILVENRSADAAPVLEVDGELLDAAATCTGGGSTRYRATVTCTAGATGECGRVGGLRPGAWVHRVRVRVPGSDEQVQAQRSVLLAAAPGVSNAIAWVVYPRTFVVRDATGPALIARLGEAATFAAARPEAQALVAFDPAVFPGADDPRAIPVRFTSRNADTDVCDEDATCRDGRRTALCLDGSRVVVDALDRWGRTGAVVLTAGRCARSLLRVTGSDNVLRGLVFEGSAKPDPTIPVDTIVLGGSGAQRNRIEQCVVYGPTLGDGISVEGAAGAPGGPSFDNVISATEVAGAEDKGIKVTGEGYALITGSCVHNNRNGGIQATLGGHVQAVHNVVQLNRLGPAQNGLLVGVPETIEARNTMKTDGNVVRFSGARGISVVNAGTGDFAHDVVTENQQAGARVERTLADPGADPLAAFRGVLLACNHKRLTGTCLPETTPCASDADCVFACTFPPAGTPDGFGLVVATCPGCPGVSADLGSGGRDAGRNALTWNANPDRGTAGVNLSTALPAGSPPLPAAGNQWQHCGTSSACNVAMVQASDVRPPGPTTAAIGTPSGPGGGPPPVITRIAPARPRAGEFVRVYNGSLEGLGGTFNAVDGIGCTGRATDPAPADLPADPCSPASDATVEINRNLDRGNRVVIAMGGQVVTADVHAVTPSMLIFRMPIDCHATATLTVSRGNDASSPPAVFCDPGSCAGRPAGTLCDDGDVCTLEERCDANGACVPGDEVACDGACRTGVCDPQLGCLVRPAGAACSDGDACSTGDTCDGASPDCLPGAPLDCTGNCLAGVCDPLAGCVPLPEASACEDGTACTVGDRCTATGTCSPGVAPDCDDGNPCTADACDPVSGCVSVALPDGALCPAADACRGPALCRAGTCDPGPALTCDDGDFCTDDLCDPAAGCRFPPVSGSRTASCHVDAARARLGDVENAEALVRRLDGRLRRTRRILDRIDPQRPGRTKSRYEQARGELRQFLLAVRASRRRLGPAIERDLFRHAKLAIANARPPGR